MHSYLPLRDVCVHGYGPSFLDWNTDIKKTISGKMLIFNYVANLKYLRMPPKRDTQDMEVEDNTVDTNHTPCLIFVAEMK